MHPENKMSKIVAFIILPYFCQSCWRYTWQRTLYNNDRHRGRKYPQARVIALLWRNETIIWPHGKGPSTYDVVRIWYRSSVQNSQNHPNLSSCLYDDNYHTTSFVTCNVNTTDKNKRGLWMPLFLTLLSVSVHFSSGEKFWWLLTRSLHLSNADVIRKEMR